MFRLGFLFKELKQVQMKSNFKKIYNFKNAVFDLFNNLINDIQL